MFAAVSSVLFAALFAATVAQNDYCSFYKTSSGEFKPMTFCGSLWNRHEFCCGTCEDRYCCSDPLKRLSKSEQDDCFLRGFRDLGTPPRRDNNQAVVIIVSVVGMLIFIILFIICWVCPCCCLYKRCRNPPPVMATTTVVTTHQLPQQQPVINGSQYPSYQPVPNNPEYGGQSAYGGQPMPTGPYQGQPYVPGPPPAYQETAGPGYHVPHSQPAYNNEKATYPVQAPAPSGFAPTDYNSPPAFNPAYVESPKTSY